jgi:uncharacterized membrane protein YczE
MNLTKALKIGFGIVATVLLGALGSGLWEMVLYPCLKYISRVVNNGISLVFTSYADSIYKSATKLANHSSPSLILLFVFFSLLIISIVVSGYHLTLLQDGRKLKRYVQLTTGNKFFFYGTVMLYAFVIGSISREFEITTIRSYSLRQMEILRPYAGEKEYHLMLSNYLRIKSKKDFKTFNDSIMHHAKTHDIKLDNLRVD